jgi:hypothetical protein
MKSSSLQLTGTLLVVEERRPATMKSFNVPIGCSASDHGITWQVIDPDRRVGTLVLVLLAVAAIARSRWRDACGLREAKPYRVVADPHPDD